MAVNSNPFLTPTYTGIWFSHFHAAREFFDFPCFEHLKFLKNPGKPIYTNFCGLDSRAIEYNVTHATDVQCAKRVYLIYDVPSYATPDITGQCHLRIKKIRQYPGFLCDLKDSENLEHYMTEHLSAKSRNKFRRYKRKLEEDFSISYRTLTGPIDKAEFDMLFNRFRELLSNRFEQKRILNNNLFAQEWAFYSKVAYAMISEKKAALSVVYDEKRPIAFSLLFLGDAHAYDTIRTFDISYAPYRLGTVSIMALLEWCFEQGIDKLNFAKGYFDYKAQWANVAYHYDYHILYNSKSVSGRMWAAYLQIYYSVKQRLREKKVNEAFYKLSYRLSKIKQ